MSKIQATHFEKALIAVCSYRILNHSRRKDWLKAAITSSSSHLQSRWLALEYQYLELLDRENLFIKDFLVNERTRNLKNKTIGYACLLGIPAKLNSYLGQIDPVLTFINPGNPVYDTLIAYTYTTYQGLDFYCTKAYTKTCQIEITSQKILVVGCSDSEYWYPLLLANKFRNDSPILLGRDHLLNDYRYYKQNAIKPFRNNNASRFAQDFLLCQQAKLLVDILSEGKSLDDVITLIPN
jgi:hypothetical protein